MTEHDTTEHIDVISEIVSSWIAIAERWDMLGVLADIKEIPEHLDALAAQLAAAEDRTVRLRKYIYSLEYDIMAIKATDDDPEKWRQGWLDEWKRTRERHGWQLEVGDLPATTDGSDDEESDGTQP